MGSSSATIGNHYRLAFWHGLCKGPIDEFIEFDGGDQIAWSGSVTETTLITVNQPQLWGGEEDQGGIEGGLRVMFGEADQLPNSYLVSIFGDQITAMRGMATVAFEGGRYGAMNPYSQPAGYFVNRRAEGWDDDECWYPAKVSVPIADATTVTTLVTADATVDSQTSSPDGSEAGYDFTVPVGSTIIVELGPSSLGWSFTPSDDYQPENYSYLVWWNRFGITNLDTPGVGGGTFWNDRYLTAAEAGAAHADDQVLIDAAVGGNYRLYLPDALIDDNRGTGSFRISYTRPVSRAAKNPAHMLVYSHTQHDTGRESIDTVNIASAETAADWFYAQGFGLGTARQPNAESPAEFRRRIEKVAACSFTRSMSDGLYYIDIANGVYVLDDLPILTDDDVLDFKEIPTVLSDAINSVSVKYFDPWRNETIITPPVRAMGLIAQFGVIHQTYDYPEIPTGEIAVRVAQRELLSSTTPTRAFDLATNRTPRSWRKNTYFRAQLLKRGITDMVCMVADLQDGQLKSGGLKLTAVQDIYSLPSTVYTQVEHGVDPRRPQTPVPAIDQRAFEAPYIDVVAAMTAAEFAALDADVGFVAAVAVDPGDSLDYSMYCAPSGGDYERKATGRFCPTALADGAVEPGVFTDIPVKNAVRLAEVVIGSAVLWDEEICRVDAIDIVAGTIDLGRGCGHTVPTRHEDSSRLYFYADYASADRTEYSAGETVDVKLLTNSGSRRLALADATAMHVTLNERLSRPYPPADLKINGVPIFEVGTSGGGSGGGGGGGGSVPTSPPAIGRDGAPASPVPGPNGGFPDDAPYPIPLPAPGDLDDEQIPGGGFDSPGDIAAWRKQDGAALDSRWVIADGKLRFQGVAHGIGSPFSTAYNYGARFSLPVMPLPRYLVTVVAKMQCDPGTKLQLGVALGFSTAGETPGALYSSDPETYPVETEVTHVFEWAPTKPGLTPQGQYVVANFMAAIRVIDETGAVVNASIDDASMVITAVPIASTAETPDHIDFDSGLTGWTKLPTPGASSPTTSVTSGTLEMEVVDAGAVFTHFICDDPLVLPDAVGKYVGVGAEVWCNDTTVYSGITYNGVALGFAYKNTSTGEYVVPPRIGEYQRGDYTDRKTWTRLTVADPLFSVHVCISMRAALGFKCRVRDIVAETTDSVVDP